jgi:hypothetical protein
MKYILIHFTRNQNINTDASITIDGMQIQPSKEGKYLGVIFNWDLKFLAQVDQAV